MREEELKLIDETLRGVRDHFESEGQKFIIAYYAISGDSAVEDGHKAHMNVMATTLEVSDYGEAFLGWGRIIDEYVFGADEELYDAVKDSLEAIEKQGVYVSPRTKEVLQTFIDEFEENDE